MPTIVANFVSSISTKKTGDFASKMWSSYTQLNPGVYSESVATEFKRRMKPDYVENLVLNFSGINATDLIGTTIGLGLFSSNTTNTIVTGNGFTKRAQRIVTTLAGGYLSTHPLVAMKVGGSYTVSFKYRASAGVRLTNGISNKDYGANTGNAISVSFTPNVIASAAIRIYPLNLGSGEWVEISEFQITKNVNSNYYNVFGPIGLNKKTADWIHVLKTIGDVTTRINTKTGNNIVWNLDGVIYEGNNLPAYTLGTNSGILTATSVDGWSGLTAIDSSVNNISHGSLRGNSNLLSANSAANKWSTTFVDNELVYYKNIFLSTAPSHNFSLDVSGVGMGYGSELAKSTRIELLNEFVAAGFSANIKFNSPVNIVWEGHSQMYLGSPLSGLVGKTIDNLSATNTISFIQKQISAVSGSLVADMVARKATKVDPYYVSTSGVKNILPILIGVNDWSFGPESVGIDVYNSVKAYCTTAISEGWTPVIILGIVSGAVADPQHVACEAARNAYNNAIRSDAVLNQHMVDVDLIPELSNSENVTYFSDKTHLADAGNLALSIPFAEVLRTIINS